MMGQTRPEGSSMKIARIAAIAIGTGLVVAAVEGEWPMVFFALLALLFLAVVARI
jgi:hypothetical protein